MEKIYTAIGDFYNDGSPLPLAAPDNEEEVYAKVEEIMDSCPCGTILTDDQVAVLRSYLPIIGCDEVTEGQNGSFEGKGTVTKNAEGCGVSVEATGECEVASRWGSDRKQWVGNMRVKRTGGDAQVKELTFEFRYLSLGMNTEKKFIVLYNEHYTRTFNDPYHLADFNGGGTAQASRIDISKHVQWGYFMHLKCALRTDQGTLTI